MAATQKQLTGKHVFAMLLAFFGVIIGVNMLMAYFANSTWSGLVVANGYVASQSFDKNLAKARAQEALGWNVAFTFKADRINLAFADKQGKPIDALTITGDLERTVTDKQDQKLAFTSMGGGVWEVEIRGESRDVPEYRKIFRFFVKE
jgi:nitrogen fixation protein FixH